MKSAFKENPILRRKLRRRTSTVHSCSRYTTCPAWLLYRASQLLPSLRPSSSNKVDEKNIIAEGMTKHAQSNAQHRNWNIPKMGCGHGSSEVWGHSVEAQLTKFEKGKRGFRDCLKNCRPPHGKLRSSPLSYPGPCPNFLDFASTP
ncbi:hypothetical protein RvY_00775 [Ramazzottius varieornatus]|uniref:Uncharacterized protein n=1 Tax=Ramazzottius varieornatus TaxID=947166 RepID=A0A1D1UK46_RAMVA|nr:hypothetical protein RvY_00775 [Ramazzottius varieornatus]